LNRDQWLAVAAEAAANQEGARMVEALWASGLPKSIAWSLYRNHRAITSFTDAEFIVAGAVAELYKKIHAGQNVNNPKALLWTVAGRRAISFARAQAATVSMPLDDNQEGISVSMFGAIQRTAAEDGARAEAIRRLRDYVARMGPGRSVTRLWTVVVDTIENEGSLTRSDLAEHLGITTNHVGVLLLRGKRAIKAMLLKEGLPEAAAAIDEWTLDAVGSGDHDKDENDDNDNDNNMEA
jgi:DNA-directed RNA polymerase specialized sigma24 family protein